MCLQHKPLGNLFVKFFISFMNNDDDYDDDDDDFYDYHDDDADYDGDVNDGEF